MEGPIFGILWYIILGIKTVSCCLLLWMARMDLD